jgi:cytidylate kinase
MYKIVTVAREYGSGGGPIAELLARQLGWSLLDNAILEKIAAQARVDPGIAERYDECLDSWFHRLSKRAFGRGAFEGVAPTGVADVFDADAMAGLSRRVIEEAADLGNCVIVGRGAQCILQNREDAFHLFVYAPLHDRIRRVRELFGEGASNAANIEAMDRLRSAYIRHHFDCNWRDPHLYHAMLCSLCGDDNVALAVRTLLGAGQESR